MQFALSIILYNTVYSHGSSVAYLFLQSVTSFITVHTDGSDCDLMEAEKRELQLNKYVHDLVKLPLQVRTAVT